MKFEKLSDLKLMQIYESENGLSLKSVFYFFLVLLLIDLAFHWAVWVGVVLSVAVFLSFLNYQFKSYSLIKELEKEIYRRNMLLKRSIFFKKNEGDL